MRVLGLMLANAALAPTAAFLLLWGTQGWIDFFRFYFGLAPH